MTHDPINTRSTSIRPADPSDTRALVSCDPTHELFPTHGELLSFFLALIRHTDSSSLLVWQHTPHPLLHSTHEFTRHTSLLLAWRHTPSSSLTFNWQDADRLARETFDCSLTRSCPRGNLRAHSTDLESTLLAADNDLRSSRTS